MVEPRNLAQGSIRDPAHGQMTRLLKGTTLLHDKDYNTFPVLILCFNLFFPFRI